MQTGRQRAPAVGRVHLNARIEYLFEPRLMGVGDPVVVDSKANFPRCFIFPAVIRSFIPFLSFTSLFLSFPVFLPSSRLDMHCHCPTSSCYSFILTVLRFIPSFVPSSFFSLSSSTFPRYNVPSSSSCPLAFRPSAVPLLPICAIRPRTSLPFEFLSFFSLLSLSMERSDRAAFLYPFGFLCHSPLFYVPFLITGAVPMHNESINSSRSLHAPPPPLFRGYTRLSRLYMQLPFHFFVLSFPSPFLSSSSGFCLAFYFMLLYALIHSLSLFFLLSRSRLSFVSFPQREPRPFPRRSRPSSLPFSWVYFLPFFFFSFPSPWNSSIAGPSFFCPLGYARPSLG